MDPLTHTFVGASLAQTRFGRVRQGTATLVIGTNLPDIDAATYFLDSQLSLGFRRGWTHGILALALMPALLGWVMHLVDLFRCRRDTAATPVSQGRLMALAYVSVLTHPALDWLNTYGVRLLMPFDGRWFYGDSLFIIDPWVWLLLGTVTVLAHSGSPARIAGWIALGALTTVLITGFPGIPLAIRVLWSLALAGIAGGPHLGRRSADVAPRRHPLPAARRTLCRRHDWRVAGRTSPGRGVGPRARIRTPPDHGGPRTGRPVAPRRAYC